MSRVLVTGGAGFVGANLCVGLATRHPEWVVVALDNLHRPGSELNLPRLEQAGVTFVRGDVRDRGALAALDPIDALIECSAEPSALAGVDGAVSYLFETNLVGAFNCLELARRDDAAFLFLSTSRVYPFGALADLVLEPAETRFELAPEQPLTGAGPDGISERFPLAGARTLYGTTKLAAELLIAEYEANFGLRAVVNRCGVIAGPWQMGHVDQGVFSFWLFQHHFERPLAYIGYGGSGRQVRDLLHVEDLIALVDEQLSDIERWRGFVGNVGGGSACSLSLLETTALCRELTGNEVPIGGIENERPGDVPYYASDCSLLFGRTDWRPRHRPEQILEQINTWLLANEAAVGQALGY